jgi:hypothetical protein
LEEFHEPKLPHHSMLTVIQIFQPTVGTPSQEAQL